MAVEYTVYVNIEAHDPTKIDTGEVDCWHPSEEIDLAKFDTLEQAENYAQALIGMNALQAEVKDLQKAVGEWQVKADSELDINAQLSTKMAELRAEKKELQGRLKNLESHIIGGPCQIQFPLEGGK